MGALGHGTARTAKVPVNSPHIASKGKLSYTVKIPLCPDISLVLRPLPSFPSLVLVKVRAGLSHEYDIIDK